MGVGRSPTHGGFSLVELLVSALVLLILALGVAALFVRAISNNHSGRESSMVTAMARERLESLLGLPLLAPELTPAAGDPDLVTTEFLSQGDDQWYSVPPASQTSLWRRTTTVTQFSYPDLSNPVSGGAPPGSFNLKRIEVEVVGLRSEAALGAVKKVRLMRFKAK